MIVTFIANEKRLEDASRKYRCDNQAKQLSNYGWTTNIFDQYDINLNIIKASNIIIFQRCVLTDEILEAYQIARECGVLVISEFDDLIFLPWLMKESGAVRSKIITNLDGTIKTSLSRYKMIPLSDYIITSTDELCKQVSLVGGKPILSRNAIDDELLISKNNPSKGKLKNILYMSGTRTHNADFMMIYKPLFRFLKEYPEVTLTLLGEVDVPDELKNLDNVNNYDKIPYAELFEFVSEHDISLVPLEDTVFNDAKSSLKFFESGYVSVPVIASPVKEFKNDIEHSENGFIAHSEEEWYNLLEELYMDEKLLFTVKLACYKDVMKKYTISGRKDSLKNELYKLWITHGKNKRLVINEKI